MVKAVSRLLAHDCDVVGSVGDGGDLLEAARRLQPEVIVLDLNLPNVDGLEACRQITHACPEIRVILFTAMSDTEIGEHFLEAGGSAFVSKLAPVGSLLSTIKRLCVDQG
jgi:DNA-binding NarL/FixJ family response regulator